MRIDDAGFGDCHDVASRMRESDFREFSAVHPTTSRADLAARLADLYGWRDDIIGFYTDRPVAIGALIENRPNTVSLLFFATDEFPTIALGVAKFVTQRLFPRYKKAGFHRIDAISIEGYEAAHRWIKAVGLEHEAELRGFGKAGETFHSFAWVRDDLRPSGA